MDERKFQNSLAKAQQLMLSEEFNQKVERSANKFNGRTNSPVNSKPIQQTDNSQYQMLQEVRMPNQTGQGIPRQIRESFNQMPSLSGDNTISQIPQSFVEPKRQVVNEQVYQQPSYTPQVHQQNGNIDYALIKTIVEECLRQQEKKMLNEGVVKAFKIGNGNKVQFLDSKGNLYEGVLTLKKRAQK